MVYGGVAACPWCSLVPQVLEQPKGLPHGLGGVLRKVLLISRHRIVAGAFFIFAIFSSS